jgi:hypothetical protein
MHAAGARRRCVPFSGAAARLSSPEWPRLGAGRSPAAPSFAQAVPSETCKCALRVVRHEDASIRTRSVGREWTDGVKRGRDRRAPARAISCACNATGLHIGYNAGSNARPYVPRSSGLLRGVGRTRTAWSAARRAAMRVSSAAVAQAQRARWNGRGAPPAPFSSRRLNLLPSSVV